MPTLTKERLVYHVVPNSSGEKWVVSQEKAEFAKEHARKAPLGQVKVHKQDGNMEYESTYGEDPRRSPG
jgi:hypothetical protein